MTRKILLGTAAIAVVLLAYLLIAERRRGELLEQQLTALKQSLSMEEERRPETGDAPATAAPTMDAVSGSLRSPAPYDPLPAATSAPRPTVAAAMPTADAPETEAGSIAPTAEAPAGAPPTATPHRVSRADRALDYQLSAAAQILGMTTAQQEALRATLQEAPEDGDGAPSFVDALRETMGEEEANTFIEQQRNAFERSTRRELNREVAYLAKLLTLSTEQEAQVQQTLSAVEVDLNALGANDPSPLHGSAQERLRALLERNRVRSKRLQEEFQKILTPDQFTAFMADEADSEAADLELWHGGPKPNGTAGDGTAP